MDGGHHLPDGVKRSLAYPRAVGGYVVFVEAELVGVGDKRRLGRLARNRTVLVYFRVAAKSHCFGYERFVVAVVVDNGHLILGEGAGLIGADYLSAAESLNCGELADYRILLRHVGNTYREDYRHDCDKALGNGGDSK